MVNGRRKNWRYLKTVKFAIVSFGALLVVLSGGWTCTQLNYFQVHRAAPRTLSAFVSGRYSNTSRFRYTELIEMYLNESYHVVKLPSESLQENLSVPLTESVLSLNVQPEARHIAFLKVHKAASSTMQNMFFRFGQKRNLTFVFTKHPNYFSRSPHFHIPLVRPRLRKGYDILCNHGVFNYQIYSSLLPNDTVYLGIVRDPLAVFVSAVNYYSQPSQRIDYIARVPGNKLKNLIHRPERYDRLFFSYTKNVMARDFGFPETNDEYRIVEKLRELDGIFLLVLIVEHFEESLVLMKRYLYWELKDILFLSNNVFGRGSSVGELSVDDVERFKTRNFLDYRLYDHFYQRFWKQYKAEPEDIDEEVKYFKKVLENLKMFCDNSKGKYDIFIVQKTEWNEEFSLDKEECNYMKKDELSFIKILRERQGSQLLPIRPSNWRNFH